MGKLIVGGIGPGTPDYLVPEVCHWVDQAQLLIGGRRALELFPDFSRKTLRITKEYRELFPEIHANLDKGNLVVVLVSGDPGVFSLLDSLQMEFPHQITVVPGISSVQVAAARLQTTWSDATILSTHHELPDNLMQQLCNEKKLFILTGPKYDAHFLLECLVEHGVLDCRVAVCADLSNPNEEVLIADLTSLSRDELDFLESDLVRFQRRSVVFVVEKVTSSGVATFRSGLGDHLFQRGDIPLTKEEIRAITLSKLRLKPDSVVYDIGSGTGSIAIQAAMFVSRGLVYAVERNPEAVELIRTNLIGFGLTNVVVLEGTAPEVFPGQQADGIFIGGSGGCLEEILSASLSRLKPQGRIVLNAVTMDTLAQIWELTQKHPDLQVEMVLAQISVLEQVGNVKLWKGRNPVYIVTIERK